MEKVNCQFVSQPVFPTPIGIYNFGATNHDLNCSLVDDAFKEYELDSEGKVFSNVKGWHSRSGLEREYRSFEKLKSLIEKSAKHYCEFYGYHSEINCNDLWVNLNKKNNYNLIHHHGSSYLTGVYYPAKSIVDNIPVFNYTNSEKSLLNPGVYSGDKNDGNGTLYFLSPSYSDCRTLYKKDINEYTTDTYHIYPTSSVLMIFPSYLLHGVNPFDEDYTRISISFVVDYNE